MNDRPQFDSSLPALFHPAPHAAGDLVELSEEEERHARAHRLRVGDGVILLDGEGHRSRGSVASVDRRAIGIRIAESVLDVARGRPYIVACLGIPDDRTRFEWCVEKAVELGVREILPMTTERSHGRIQHERARRIAIAALKQSQRAYLPIIPMPVPFGEVTDRIAEFDAAYLCHEAAPADQPLAAALRQQGNAGRILVLIGPEGGFSDREVEAGRAAGAHVVSLGAARLRSETATIVALALVANLLDANEPPQSAGASRTA